MGFGLRRIEKGWICMWCTKSKQRIPMLFKFAKVFNHQDFNEPMNYLNFWTDHNFHRLEMNVVTL